MLQTRQLAERHTAPNVASEIESVLHEWEIRNGMLSAIVHDNARNIVAAMNLLGCKHLSCVGHTLQLAVNNALDLAPVARVLQRCRKVVGHFSHSYVAQSELSVKQSALNLPKHKLIQEVATRWNSSLEMAKRILEQQSAISAVLLQSHKRSDRELLLSPADITLLEHIVEVLQPFAEATTMLSSEKYVSVSVVQPILKALLKKHLRPSDTDSQIVTDMKAALYTSLSSHFSDSDQQKLMVLATVLDPRFKSLKFLPSAERKHVYVDLLDAATDLWATERGEMPPSLDLESGSSPLPKRKKMGHCLLDFTDSGSDTSGSSPSRDVLGAVDKEVSNYQTESEISNSEDPLLWWRLNEHRFKTLSILARRLLCIPATSVPCERLFSSAGNIVNKKRASLHPENVDCLCFLNKNL